MCLIIDRPAGSVIPDEYIRAGLENNPHGWGIMYPGDDDNSELPGLVIRRGLTDDGFWNAYRQIPPDVRVGIHFRWATHGSVSMANVHPFVHAGAGLAVMHNGVIDTPCVDPDRSDTYHYVTGVLGPWLVQYPDGLSWADDIIAPNVGGSRLLLYRADGTAVRVNDRSGHVEDGIWYSNRSSLYVSRFPYRPAFATVARRWADEWADEPSGSYGTGWADDDAARYGTGWGWRSPGRSRTVEPSGPGFRGRVTQVRRMLEGVERNHGAARADTLAWRLTASAKPHVSRGAWEYIGFPEGDPTVG